MEALPSSPLHHKMTSSISFPPNGDYIGTESCIDLQNDSGFDSSDSRPSNSASTSICGAKQPSSRKKKEKREFPPPITLLARTQNLPSHMPWVLKRYYTSDGRLILKEEKVRYHEYFRVHRANGRLTLQLVPLDHDMLDSLPLVADQNDEFLGTSEVEGKPISPRETKQDTNYDIDQSLDADRCTDEEDGRNIVQADELAMENEKAVVSANGATKCLNFTRVKSAPSCIFGVPVDPIRTVQG